MDAFTATQQAQLQDLLQNLLRRMGHPALAHSFFRKEESPRSDEISAAERRGRVAGLREAANSIRGGMVTSDMLERADRIEREGV